MDFIIYKKYNYLQFEVLTLGLKDSSLECKKMWYLFRDPLAAAIGSVDYQAVYLFVYKVFALQK